MVWNSVDARISCCALITARVWLVSFVIASAIRLLLSSCNLPAVRTVASSSTRSSTWLCDGAKDKYPDIFSNTPG